MNELEIEDEAAPLLIPMLQNEEVELRPEEQRTLARWATLKLLVAQELHPSLQRIIDPSRYRLFYIDRSLPLGAQVWLGRYSGGGPWPTNYRFQTLFMTMHGENEPPLPNAYLAGFTIGYLAFVYWGHEIRNGACRGHEPDRRVLNPNLAGDRYRPLATSGTDGGGRS